MKLREYEYMLAIAQEANMTRAAQRLYISQPALSKLLASVESELGVQLFRQENRRMIPTAAGKIYLENAEKILSLNHDMERTVRLASIGCASGSCRAAAPWVEGSPCLH